MSTTMNLPQWEVTIRSAKNGGFDWQVVFATGVIHGGRADTFEKANADAHAALRKGLP